MKKSDPIRSVWAAGIQSCSLKTDIIENALEWMCTSIFLDIAQDFDKVWYKQFNFKITAGFSDTWI